MAHEENEDYVEFHLTDDDLPPEALKDCMKPPRQSTLVACLHCGEEYDSWRMAYRVRAYSDGAVRGFWECGIPGCDGAGFMFDIFPTDPNYVAEDGALQGEWVEDHEDDCECEDCVQVRAEIEQWEKDHPLPATSAAEEAALAGGATEGSKSVEDQITADRQRIQKAMAGLGPLEEGGAIPLDDLLPSPEESDEPADELSHETAMQIEHRLGLRTTGDRSSVSPPQTKREPFPLPPNWRELLARQDERIENAGGEVGEDDIPF
ncbi:MAG: hypothetical protein L0Y44_10175 [Phycisphaerales bacterium]|nr:hypothetical protein [Phycisphaerales bacterium]MCI0631003.1 hypothetical protein [Phycisphaerales bacterium]MCI0676484.1 hypothetical protein [Phycisphaerales bacterium]